MNRENSSAQLWVTCFLTDILLAYMKETAAGNQILDYAGLFRGAEGFETPPNPELFLSDVNNWVPLSVLRELEIQCEKISGKKDVAYHAARAYFEPGKQSVPSLFEIIVRVLNDVRSAFVFANLWGAAQTNYLKIQAFEKDQTAPELFLLVKFDEHAPPALGAINLLRGFCEGFPRLYPFIENLQCSEEFSQLRLEDIVREFPGFSVIADGDRAIIHHGSSEAPIVEAVKVPLKSEVIPMTREYMRNTLEAAVVALTEDQIRILVPQAEPKHQHSPEAFVYEIVRPGVIKLGPLFHKFERGRFYGAPYSRFRISWIEKLRTEIALSPDDLRRQISRLLFEHLRHVKQSQTRVIECNIEKNRLSLENIRLREAIEREYSFSGIIGESQKMQELFGLVRSAAGTDVTVIIQGETGTGKELIARAIHYNGARKEKRFVAVNCGALSETLLESELFGHEKGAFTGATSQRKGIFEVSDGGSLFLDEIGEISPSTQVKLLRVLQEGEFHRVGGTDPIKVDVRIIVATNRNLEELVKQGPFRPDFYYRLNVFPITVPPLRERAEDIPSLVAHFVRKSNQRMNKQIEGLSPDAVAALMSYSWPGNIRELENVIQRMMVTARGNMIGVDELPNEIRGSRSQTAARPKDLKEISRESSEAVERRTILDALSKTGGNVTQAAKLLGVSRATLQNKMKMYGLRSPKE